MIRQKFHGRLLLVAIGVALMASGGAISVATPPALAVSSDEWTGNGDGHSWGDGSNWSTQHSPHSGDNVTISATPPAHVTGATGMNLASLTVGNSNTLTSTSGAAPFRISKLMHWDSGEMDASLVLAPGAVGLIGDQEKKVLGQNFDIEVQSGATLDLDNISLHPLVLWNPDTITIDRGATLNSIGTNELSYIACCVNPARVVNKGKIELSKYLGTTPRLDLSAIALTQSGTVDTGHAGLMDVSGPVSMTGGTVTGSGSLQLDGPVDRHVSGTMKITPSARIEHMAGSLFGSGTITGGGTWDLGGGAIFGHLTVAHGTVLGLSPGARATIGAWDKDNVGRVDNHGTAIFTGGVLSIDSATQFVNDRDGKLTLFPGVLVTSQACCVNPSGLVNHGLLEVPKPPSGVPTGTPATIDEVSYQSDSKTEIAHGQVLAIGPAPATFSKGAELTGTGNLTVAGPLALLLTKLPVAANETVRLLPRAALTTGTRQVTFGSPGSSVDWTGGTIAGKLTIPKNVNLRISGTDGKALVPPATGRTIFTTEGTSTFESGSGSSALNALEIDPSQQWRNEGKLTVAGNTHLWSISCCLSPAMLTNVAGAQLIFVPGRAGRVLDDGVEVQNDGGTVQTNSGTVLFDDPSYVQLSGVTQIASGAMIGQSQPTDVAQVEIDGGSLAGTGTVTGTLAVRGGVVNPNGSHHVGTLDVNGNFVQGPGGAYDADIASRSSADRISVTGTASVAGVLNGVTKAGWKPPARTSVAVLSARDITGQFDCVLSQGAGGLQWREHASATRVTLVAMPPAPTGCNVLHAQAPARIGNGGSEVAAGSPVDLKVAGRAGVPVRKDPRSRNIFPGVNLYAS